MNGFNGLLHSASLCLVLAACIWQSVFAHFEEVVSQEKTSEGILHCLHHRNYVVQDLLRANLVALYVDAASCDKQIYPWYNFRGMLDSLVDIDHLPPPSSVIFEVILEF